MKKINKTYSIILACIAFIGHSCTDLEEDLSSVFFLETLATETDITTALIPLYRELADAHGQPHQIRTITYGADDLTTWTAGNKEPFRAFDGFDYGNGENTDIRLIDWAWNAYWKTIYFSNTTIEGLKTSTAPESAVAIGDAEARVLRAYSYLHLVKSHGNMPIITDLGAPTGEEERATVLENYQQIESDLLIAEANLPAPGAEETGHVNSAFAKSVLADLYLTWAGWPVNDNSKYELAASTSKEIIDSGAFTLLPIDQLWLSENENSSESIFSLQFSEVEDNRSNYATAFSFHQARGFSDAFPEFQFFEDFPEGARKDATFILDIPSRGVTNGLITTNDPPTTPWPESDRGHTMYGKFTAAEDLTIALRTSGYRARELYRYAEILLIYAEAQARIGENASSIEALNQVKRRAAGLPYLTPDASVDVTSATVDEIIAEKGWELAGEYKRWFDLVRTEKVEEVAARRDPAESVPLLNNPTKNNYIAPIPFTAIITSNLVQNPEGFVIQ